MSKIICDVCGTRYPDSSEQCPICGCVRYNAAKEPEQTAPVEEMDAPSRPAVRGGRFSKGNVRKRNKNQPVYDEAEVPVKMPEPEENYDSEEEMEEEGGDRANTIINVLLAIVIMALLAVSAYIFLNFFMPNLKDDEEIPTEAEETYMEQVEMPTDAQTPTDAPYVFCEQLVLDVSDVTLRQAGDMYLLNVQVLPEDTSDGIVYISSNEDVATVDEGRVTAVGEGSVVISILCGDQQIQCNVICDFSSAEAATEAPAVTPTETPAAPTETPAAPTEAPVVAPTEAPAQNLKNVKLKVKSTDMTFKTGGQQATIKMSCDLKPSEVTWTSENSAVATVTADGVITRVGAGTTTIIGQYGEQKVEITVRCPRK